MFKLAKKGKTQKVTNRVTRSQKKHIFKLDIKIGKEYVKSPLYIGIQLWDTPAIATQMKDNIFEFEKEIVKLYRNHKELHN